MLEIYFILCFHGDFLKHIECFQDVIFSKIFKTQARNLTQRMPEFYCVLLSQTYIVAFLVTFHNWNPVLFLQTLGILYQYVPMSASLDLRG